MPKIYVAGDQLSAADFNAMVKVAGSYATSTTGNDTYVITAVPTPGSYADGDEYTFKPDTANTGAASLNVNSLGAKTIKKFGPGGKVDLDTGDILANQTCRVKYDGTDFILISAIPSAFGLHTTGNTTKALSDASTTQNIAHGLGRIPRFVRITVAAVASEAGVSNLIFGWSTYDGTTQAYSTFLQYAFNTESYNAGTGAIIVASINGNQAGTITFDATNIIITWVKTSAPTITININWEAHA